MKAVDSFTFQKDGGSKIRIEKGTRGEVKKLMYVISSGGFMAIVRFPQGTVPVDWLQIEVERP